MDIPETITLQLVASTASNLAGIIVGLTVSTGQRNPRRIYFPKTDSKGRSILDRSDFLGQFADSTEADLMGSWGGIDDASSEVEVALFDPAPALAAPALSLAWPLFPHERQKWGSRKDEYNYRASCRNAEFTADPLIVDLHETTRVELRIHPSSTAG